MSTLALAYEYIYFEKLVLKDVVRKENRRLYFSVCVVLALKFSEPPDDCNDDEPVTVASSSTRNLYERGSSIAGVDNSVVHTNTKLRKVLAALQTVMEISIRDIMSNELKVFAELDFALHIPLDAVSILDSMILELLCCF